MTTLTAPARQSAPKPVTWTKLAWVGWRQHRATLAALTALIAGFAVVMIISGLRAHGQAATLGLNRCGAPASPRCVQEYFAFLNHSLWGYNYNLWGSDLPVFLQVVPLVIGMFLGGPLLAQEYEHRTVRFAWTQATGRTRWLLAKLSLLGLLVAGLAVALGLLFRWWYAPFGAHQGPWGHYEFDLQPVALAGWALLALSLGVVLGTAFRRTVPAVAATGAAYGVLAVLAAWKLRPHYLPPVTRTFAFAGSGPPATSLFFGYWWTGPGGRVLGYSASQAVLGRMKTAVGRRGTNADAAAWLARHHYAQWWSYQPASRFWPFQLIEGGWLLALSAVLVAATVWLVRRRAA